MAPAFAGTLVSPLLAFTPENAGAIYLPKKIQTKDEVLAELMAEHVALKEDIGEL